MFPQTIDVQSKIEIKKKDIEKLQEREKALNATFQASLGENNKFTDYLTKVFKKKIKRTKKKQTEGDGECSIQACHAIYFMHSVVPHVLNLLSFQLLEKK